MCHVSWNSHRDQKFLTATQALSKTQAGSRVLWGRGVLPLTGDYSEDTPPKSYQNLLLKASRAPHPQALRNQELNDYLTIFLPPQEGHSRKPELAESWPEPMAPSLVPPRAYPWLPTLPPSVAMLAEMPLVPGMPPSCRPSLLHPHCHLRPESCLPTWPFGATVQSGAELCTNILLWAPDCR